MSENLRLRTQYRQEIHKYWNSNSNCQKEWQLLQSIKQKIFKFELGESKNFYIYKSFID